MAGIWTADGITSFVGSGLAPLAWLNGLTLRLFTNNITPAVTDHAGAYSEATFPGYAPTALVSWVSAGLDANNNWAWGNPPVDFSSTGGSGDTVYGYYLTDGAGNLVMAEAAPSPFPMSAAGLTYRVAPTFYLGQILPPV